jgi:hypothetical protein
LPLKRSELVAVLTDENTGLPLKTETLDEIITRVRTAPRLRDPDLNDLEGAKGELSAKLPGDDIWIVGDDAVPFGAIMAGRGDDIHTIRLRVVTVSVRSREEGARINTMLSAVFSRIYPNWPEAAQWPAKSFADTWSLWEPVITDPKRDPNEFVIRKTIDGITSATFGVPPDLVEFVATTREQCIPDMRDRSFHRRGIC